MEKICRNSESLWLSKDVGDDYPDIVVLVKEKPAKPPFDPGLEVGYEWRPEIVIYTIKGQVTYPAAYLCRVVSEEEYNSYWQKAEVSRFPEGLLGD